MVEFDEKGNNLLYVHHHQFDYIRLYGFIYILAIIVRVIFNQISIDTIYIFYICEKTFENLMQ